MNVLADSGVTSERGGIAHVVECLAQNRRSGGQIVVKNRVGIAPQIDHLSASITGEEDGKRRLILPEVDRSKNPP